MKCNKHYFQIRIVDKTGLVLFHERPRDLAPGDTMTYGPASFDVLIDGKPHRALTASIQFKWLEDREGGEG